MFTCLERPYAQCRLINENAFHEVMRDDFDGNQIDFSEWEYKNCHEHGLYFRPENVSVSGGVLHLANIIDPFITINSCTNSHNGFWSGGIKTVSNKAFPRGTQHNQLYPNGYMIFEARVKIQSDIGIWPAFWLHGGNGNELDIFEFYHGNDGPKFTTSTHEMNDTGCSNEWKYPDINFDEWHTFAAAWRLRQDHNDAIDVTFFLDGKELWTRNNVLFHPGTGFLIQMNNGYQTWAMQGPNETLVDYIRVLESPLEDINLLKEEYFTSLQLTNGTCHSREYSLDVGEDNQVFFNNNGWMATYHYNNGPSGQWHLGWLTSFNSNESISGDVKVGPENVVYYRGTDGWLHKYKWNGSWQHSIITFMEGWKVSSKEGSIALGYGNESPELVCALDHVSSAIKILYVYDKNGWVPIVPPNYDGGNFNGDLTLVGERIFYRGVDNKLYYYQKNGSLWQRFLAVNEFNQSITVRSAPGSIARSRNDPGQCFIVDPNGWVRTVYAKGNNIWGFGFCALNFYDNERVSSGSNIMLTNDDEIRIIYKNTAGVLRYYKASSLSPNWWEPGEIVDCKNGNSYDPVSNNIRPGVKNQLFYRSTAGYVRNLHWRCCANYNECAVSTVVFRGDENEISPQTPGADDNERSINVYPNPGFDKINIECKNDTPFQVLLLDNQGKIVWSDETWHRDLINIDISILHSGLYFIKVLSDRTTETVKLVKM